MVEGGKTYGPMIDESSPQDRRTEKEKDQDMAKWMSKKHCAR